MATDSLLSIGDRRSCDVESRRGPSAGACAQEPVPAFVLLSFEGPDAYSMAGGLGSRVSGLACALAEEGYETHLFFIGSPDLPGHEVAYDGKLHLHRWCQWISQYHPGGVYDGEEAKLSDWNSSLPTWVAEQLLPTLLE